MAPHASKNAELNLTTFYIQLEKIHEKKKILGKESGEKNLPDLYYGKKVF